MWGVLLKACKYDSGLVLAFLIEFTTELDREDQKKFNKLYKSYFE